MEKIGAGFNATMVCSQPECGINTSTTFECADAETAKNVAILHEKTVPGHNVTIYFHDSKNPLNASQQAEINKYRRPNL